MHGPKCPVCTKTFAPKNGKGGPKQRFCSNGCRKKAHKEALRGDATFGGYNPSQTELRPQISDQKSTAYSHQNRRPRSVEKDLWERIVRMELRGPLRVK